MAYIDKYGQPWDCREEADIVHRQEHRQARERAIDQAGLRELMTAIRTCHQSIVAQQVKELNGISKDATSLNEQRKPAKIIMRRWQPLLTLSTQQLSALYELADELVKETSQ